MPLPLNQQADRSFAWQYRAIRKKHPDVYALIELEYKQVAELGHPSTKFSIINELRTKYACSWCKLIHCQDRVNHANKQMLYEKAMLKARGMHSDTERASVEIRNCIDKMPSVATLSDEDYVKAMKDALALIKKHI